MPQESHDHNFKNLFLDFSEEALEFIYPQALKHWGKITKIEFVRQEPKKHKLADGYLSLDMPILFSFEKQQFLLWLVEFQEDKSKFSIHKLLIYTVQLMEAYPDAKVLPTVLFTDRTKWRKDVCKNLEIKIFNELFLQFKYVFVKLFDFKARDYYNSDNPLVKILLPKMSYEPEERFEVIRQAYMGLFQLTSAVVFDKYVDFIDVYAKINEDEREKLYNEIIEHKETIMLAQYIRNKGVQQGLQQGVQQGVQQGNTALINRLLIKKFNSPADKFSPQLKKLNTDALFNLGEYILDCDSLENIEYWIQDHLQVK